MSSKPRPPIRTLNRAECDAVLARNHVGRIACARGNRMDIYTIPGEGSATEHEEWERAVGLLRTRIPETFTPDDPAAFRQVLFRIAVQDVSGRESLPGGAE